MSTSTVSATNIQDPTGQVFANGTWSLSFQPTYGRSGPFTDGGVVFTKFYGGSLDANGSFSQAGVNRNDTISPAGSTWMLQVTPAVGGQTFQVALNVNSPAFDATALINAVIAAQAPAGIKTNATPIARAYKDAELINADGSGAIYYDETLKVLKVWDAITGVWQIVDVNTSLIFAKLDGSNQPFTGAIASKQIGPVIYADQFTGADMGAKINAAIAFAPVTGAVIDATAFQGVQQAAATINVNKPCLVKFGGVTLQLAGSPGINLSNTGASVIGLGPGATILQLNNGTNDAIQSNAINVMAKGFSINSAVARTGGAGIRCKGGNGVYEDFTIDKTFNGIQVTDSLAGASGNNAFKRIVMGSLVSPAGSWNAGVILGGVASGTVTGEFFEDVVVIGTSAFADAMCVLDSGCDTNHFTDCQFVQGGVDSFCLSIRNTNTSNAPQWDKFNTCVFEAGNTKTAITIAAGILTNFVNCSLATCGVFFQFNGGTSIHVTECKMVGCQQQAINITAGTDINITNNRIADSSLSVNGGFNTIQVSANVTDFNIIGNNFGTILNSVNQPFQNISIPAGTSDNYCIVGNKFANFASAGLGDAGTGSNKFIYGNMPAQANIFKNDLNSRRLKANQASALVIGDFVASAGFGTTAAFTIALGHDQGGQVTITPGGAGITANPTVTLTFHDGTWGTAPTVVVSRGDLNAPTTGFWIVSSVSATQAVFTFVGLPVSGTSYILQFVTMGV